MISNNSSPSSQGEAAGQADAAVRRRQHRCCMVFIYTIQVRSSSLERVSHVTGKRIITDTAKAYSVSCE